VSRMAERLRRQNLNIPQKLELSQPEVKLPPGPDWKTLKSPDTGKVYVDPRPDMPEDSFLWLQFFAEIDKTNPQLYEYLKYMRTAGTRIVQGKSQYVLRPDIDPEGAKSWASEKMYEEYRDKWLMPHKDLIKEKLKNLFQWSQASSSQSSPG